MARLRVGLVVLALAAEAWAGSMCTEPTPPTGPIPPDSMCEPLECLCPTADEVTPEQLGVDDGAEVLVATNATDCGAPPPSLVPLG